MNKYKKFVKRGKNIYGSFSIFSFVFFIVGVALCFNESLFFVGIILTVIFFIFLAVFLILFICMCSINIKEYTYKGIKIEAYSGIENHYLFVNDEEIDNFVCLFSFTPIKLTGKYLDNAIEVTIGLDNNINLRVNGERVKPNKNK